MRPSCFLLLQQVWKQWPSLSNIARSSEILFWVLNHPKGEPRNWCEEWNGHFSVTSKLIRCQLGFVHTFLSLSLSCLLHPPSRQMSEAGSATFGQKGTHIFELIFIWKLVPNPSSIIYVIFGCSKSLDYKSNSNHRKILLLSRDGLAGLWPSEPILLI